MLHQRRMGSFNRKGKRSARFFPVRKVDRFRSRYPRIAFAHDFRPTADHPSLDESKSLETRPGNTADEVATGARMAATRGLFSGFGTQGLRHLDRPCHSD